jgi:predicted histidine transporter YuiF (NhaC family)
MIDHIRIIAMVIATVAIVVILLVIIRVQYAKKRQLENEKTLLEILKDKDLNSWKS